MKDEDEESISFDSFIKTITETVEARSEPISHLEPIRKKKKKFYFLKNRGKDDSTSWEKRIKEHTKLGKKK